MILKYFRSNQPAILLTLPLVALIFWMPHFWVNNEAFIPRGFLLEKLDNILHINHLIYKIVSFLLVILQGFMINSLINQSEVFSKLSHVPSLMLIILGTVLSYRGGLEPMSFGNVFILLALRSTLQVYHQNSAIGITFNIGFWLGMAALFEPLCLLLLIPAFVSVLILRAADWRELFFLLVGSGLPLFFLQVICFVIDVTFDLPQSYFHFSNQTIPYLSDPLFVFFLILGGFIFLRSLYFYFKSLRGIILRVRKMRMVFIYFSLTITGIYTWLFYSSPIPFQNQMLLIPGTLIFSYLYIHHPRPFFIDFLFYVFIVVWGFFVYNLYFL